MFFIIVGSLLWRKLGVLTPVYMRLDIPPKRTLRPNYTVTNIKKKEIPTEGCIWVYMCACPS